MFYWNWNFFQHHYSYTTWHWQHKLFHSICIAADNDIWQYKSKSTSPFDQWWPQLNRAYCQQSFEGLVQAFAQNPWHLKCKDHSTTGWKGLSSQIITCLKQHWHSKTMVDNMTYTPDQNRWHLEHGGASREHNVLVEASPHVNGAVLHHGVHSLGYWHWKTMQWL